MNGNKTNRVKKSIARIWNSSENHILGSNEIMDTIIVNPIRKLSKCGKFLSKTSNEVCQYFAPAGISLYYAIKMIEKYYFMVKNRIYNRYQSLLHD